MVNYKPRTRQILIVPLFSNIFFTYILLKTNALVGLNNHNKLRTQIGYIYLAIFTVNEYVQVKIVRK